MVTLNWPLTLHLEAASTCSSLFRHEHVLMLFPNLCPALRTAHPARPPHLNFCPLPHSRTLLRPSRCRTQAVLAGCPLPLSRASIFCWLTCRTWWLSSKCPGSGVSSWSIMSCSWTHVVPHSCRKLHTCVVHASCVSFSFFRASSCSHLGRGSRAVSGMSRHRDTSPSILGSWPEALMTEAARLAAPTPSPLCF